MVQWQCPIWLHTVFLASNFNHSAFELPTDLLCQLLVEQHKSTVEFHAVAKLTTAIVDFQNFVEFLLNVEDNSQILMAVVRQFQHIFRLAAGNPHPHVTEMSHCLNYHLGQLINFLIKELNVFDWHQNSLGLMVLVDDDFAEHHLHLISDKSLAECHAFLPFCQLQLLDDH